MEDEVRRCRRCFLYESGETDILEDIKRRIEKIPKKDKAPENVYASRLADCSNCEHLVGGVCMKCGCYPEFRAAFIKNKCPDVASKKWQMQ